MTNGSKSRRDRGLRIYSEKLKKGLCGGCGKRKRYESKSRCKICLNKAKIRNKLRRR